MNTAAPHSDDSNKQNKSWGCWPSSISPEMVASAAPRLGEAQCHGQQLYWLQSLAEESGRVTIMRGRGENYESILAAPYSVRSRVHEYGGQSLCFSDTELFFVNAEDQGIYRLALEGSGEPVLLFQQDNLRFADLVFRRQSAPYQNPREQAHRNQENLDVQSTETQSLIAVAEQHSDKGVSNFLVCISLDGQIHTLETGADFYAYPRLNHDGSLLCWISWMHPDMPWDNTRLHIAQINKYSLTKISTLDPEKVKAQNTDAVASQASIVQPLWAADNSLFFISDQNNWWNLWQLKQQDLAQPEKATVFYKQQAECATPLWVLGMQHYRINKDSILFAFNQHGRWQLAKLALADKTLETIGDPCASIEAISFAGEQSCFIQSGSTYAARVCSYEDNQIHLHGQPGKVDRKEISSAQAMQFGEADKRCHGFYYAPHNSNYSCDRGAPPLIVLCHGGPTGQSDCSLNYKIQFWTNRGFAVVDINYRGSTGYGRHYRRSLYKNWGICDVEDVKTVCTSLVEQGLANPEALIIKGSSAGGYTVLAALCFTELFSTGTSLYGIGDLESLATDTHKFEQHYLDQLIGPYPECREIYKQRSPINDVDRFSCPLLLFQGLDDKVVPPNQAKKMAAAVRNKGLAVTHVEFEGEGHGFRQAKTVIKMLETELDFYQRVLKLEKQA
ncbi:alpha/beta hydrolase family protein [Agaribacterium haliotis]|uniref:alpha/beta hydrolase family protein n=1 Tax=Agaribacterium haliotis TaxID=2013869 RepID=UPI000BB53C24|nr:prolyl oligopeptidase family serine peptidase [Agaribacterium haliotis]